jgi:hypothetical protein
MRKRNLAKMRMTFLAQVDHMQKMCRNRLLQKQKGGSHLYKTRVACACLRDAHNARGISNQEERH